MRLLLLSLFLSLLVPRLANATGEARLPLQEWEQTIDAIAEHKRRAEPPASAAIVRRQIEATFLRGVLRGNLTVEVEAIVGKTPIEVPIIGRGASPREVRVNGAQAVVTPSQNAYAVLISQSGRHRIELRFVSGEQQDRFQRAFRLALPQAPVTLVKLDLPERDLDIEVEGGAVLTRRQSGDGTEVTLALGGVDALGVRWQRRLSHGEQAREMEARAYVLASVREDVLRCETDLAYRMLAGETSRLEIGLPEGVEVTHVTGDAVLQWTTERSPTGERRLLVLLRYLVDNAVTVRVHTQMPRGDDGVLRLVRPLDAVLREGFVAVEGRAGMEIRVTSHDGATEIGTRELPQELIAMSQRPLLFGYRYEETPKLAIKTKRNAEVTLTEAVIDELEATTVVTEPGLELTKLRLHVRNNARQYLSMTLPEGAVLTHALLDGTAFHPAVSRPQDAREVLLVPLRQSERLSGDAARYHIVRPGETLLGLALRYYNKVESARDIVAHNPELNEQGELMVGQRLVIPRQKRGTTVEESSFTIELAYKLERRPLGLFGRQATALPALDLPVMDMSWHYFFPEIYTPLSFHTNLKRHNALRYGIIERFGQFLSVAFSGRRAWAGQPQGKYANILRSRKAIFQAEQKTQAAEALASFPLVGERYRFSRVLLGDSQAVIGFTYMQHILAWPLRLLAFVMFLAGFFLILRRAEDRGRVARRDLLWLGLVTALWLFVAHHVAGVHRAMLFGANTGMLALALVRLVREHWHGFATLPPSLASSEVLRPRTLARLFGLVMLLGFFAMFPMLIGLGSFAVLMFLHARRLRRLLTGASVTTALVLLLASPSLKAREVTLPLSTWTEAREELAELTRTGAARARDAVIGETTYRGHADAAGLHLHLVMRAHLGAGAHERNLPIIGQGAILLAATSAGRPLALSRDGQGWRFVTREQGMVTIEADILVPPSGPRGSLEYRFGVPKSPATELTCLFTGAKLSPRVTEAVTNELRATSSGTELFAVLGPVSEIHVVGFHELESPTDDREAKLYAETQNLFSLGDDRIELFAVVRLNILYAPHKRFRVQLPAGYELASADGEGAFQYTVEQKDGARILTGETAYGIRQSYEISLRLERLFAKDEVSVPLALPKLLGVERDSGFVAIEVPGKLSIERVKGELLRPIDIRELPVELIESSVTPIVRAFQYDQGGVEASASIGRYPEKSLAPGGVDELIAETVLTSDGRLMTDLRFAMRNNLQQYLALTLDERAVIRSAFVEGEPVKPSRDDRGDVLLPLVRSPQGHDGLTPIRMQIVYELPLPALGAFGVRRLALPKLHVPLAMARWKVHVPQGYLTSAPRGVLHPQRFAGRGSFSLPPPPAPTRELWEEEELLAPAGVGQLSRGPSPAQTAGEASGAMSVRIELPRSGKTLSHVRYWIAEGEPIFVSFRYLTASLALSLKAILLLALAALIGLLGWPMASRTPARRRTKRVALATGALALALGGGICLAWPPVIAGVIAGGAVLAWRHALISALGRWLATFFERNSARLKADIASGYASWIEARERSRTRSLLFATLGLGGSALRLACKLGLLLVIIALAFAILRSLLAVLASPA